MQFTPIKNRLDFIGLLIISLSLPISDDLKNVGVILAIVGFFRNKLKYGGWPEPSMFNLGIYLYILTALLSALLSDDILKGLYGSKDIIRMGLVFFVARSMSNEEDILIIIKCFIYSSVIAALFALYRSTVSDRILETHILGNANYTAMYFGIAATAVISAILAFRHFTAASIAFYVLSLSILMISVVKTTMRSTFISLAFFITIVIYKFKNIRAYLMGAVSAVILVLMIIFYQPMNQKIFLTHSLTVGRHNIWHRAVQLFYQSPLLGIGPNHFIYSGPEETVFDAHSLYFQTLSQLGILGFIALVFMMAGFVRFCIRFSPKDSGVFVKYSAIGAFLVIFIAGILDTTLHHEHGLAFMMLTGFMFSYSKEP